MAKWGEGDPRWIVEERADSHNVNNWHWKEVDANKWSEERLRDLLMAVKVRFQINLCFWKIPDFYLCFLD